MPFCENTNLPRRSLLTLSLRAAGLAVLGGTPSIWAQSASFPISDQQRATAERVAQAGVPLSELVAGAPDSHTVKPGDTLWGISKLFLSDPWRWPELWGMNRDQISNPHLIYPGQLLLLVKMDGRARLQLAQQHAAGESQETAKLSPRIRASDFDGNAITAIPLNLIEPFLNDAVVFDTDELASAPRIVATPENRVLLAPGDLAYARGDLSQATDYRVFRNTRPLVDPSSGEILGFEAPYLGAAELKKLEELTTLPNGKTEIVPATLKIKAVRREIGVGDRLSPVPARSFSRYIPHAPSSAIGGQIISIYGDGLNAGQNQIVALNRGRRDGLERGHVLALWKQGVNMVDGTSQQREVMRLPDERHGVLFVFQVYERVSYALIISVKEPVKAGDRFSQP